MHSLGTVQPTSLSEKHCILLWGSYTGELSVRLDSRHHRGRIKNGKHSIIHSTIRWHYLHWVQSPCCAGVYCTIKETPETCPHTTFHCEYCSTRNIKGVHTPCLWATCGGSENSEIISTWIKFTRRPWQRLMFACYWWVDATGSLHTSD